jgi:hypothetical protein
MANVKISQLTAGSALTGAEEIPVVQGSSTVRTTAQDIADLAGGVTGGGTTTTIPLFNASTNVTNSVITQVSGNIRIGSNYGQTKKVNVQGDIDLTGVLSNNGTQIINVGTDYIALGDGTGKLFSSDVLVDSATLEFTIGGAFVPYTLTNYGNVVFSGLPTSSAGLPSGALWRNGTVINIVP